MVADLADINVNKHPRSGLPPTVLYNLSYLQLQLQSDWIGNSEQTMYSGVPNERRNQQPMFRWKNNPEVGDSIKNKPIEVNSIGRIRDFNESKEQHQCNCTSHHQ